MQYEPYCESVAYDDVIVYFQSDEDDICLYGDDAPDKWLDTFLGELSLTMVESPYNTYIIHLCKVDDVWECDEVTRVMYDFEFFPNGRSKWVSSRCDVHAPILMGGSEFTPGQLCQLFNENLL